MKRTDVLSRDNFNMGEGAILFLGGFLLTLGNVFTLSPFALSFACCKKGTSPFAYIGAAIGYFLFAPEPIKYIAALALCYGALLFLGYREQLAAPFVALASIYASGILYYLLSGAPSAYLISVLSEGFLAFGACYFFSVANEVIYEDKRNIFSTSKQERISIVAAASFFLIPLFFFDFLPISLGVSVSSLISLYIAYAISEGAGATIAAVVFSLSALGGAIPFSAVGAFVLASILAGVFADFSKFISALSFIATVALYLLLTETENPIYLLIATAIATTTFMIIPAKAINAISEKAKIKDKNGFIKEMVGTRLQNVAQGLMDVSKMIEGLYQRTSPVMQRDVSYIFTEVEESLCRKCSRRDECTGEFYSEMLGGFNDIRGTLKSLGEISHITLPRFFKIHCKNRTEIINKINSNYKEMVLVAKSKQRIIGMRDICRDNLSGMSSMLLEIKDEIAEIKYIDTELIATVEKAMLRRFKLKEAKVATLTNGRKIITLIFRELEKEDIKEVLNILVNICDASFTYPTIDEGSNIHLTFYEKAVFIPTVGYAQRAYPGEKYCGDAIRYFCDNKDNLNLVISDGMGSGHEAAIDGNFAAISFSKLMKAGMTFESVSKFLSSTLLVKSEEESLCTIDAISLDLYTGAVKNLKAGACPTYILRGDKFIKYSNEKLPMGILAGESYPLQKFRVYDGDVLIMMTDGGAVDDGSWLEEYKSEIKSKAPAAAAQFLCEKAHALSLGFSDDITFAVVKVEREEFI